MLGFGLAFASFYALCLRWTVKHPTFLFWLPLIFYQAIKAETESVTVLNQLTKGVVVAFLLHWIIDVKLITAHWRKTRGKAGRKPSRWLRGRSTAPVGEQVSAGEAVAEQAEAEEPYGRISK